MIKGDFKGTRIFKQNTKNKKGRRTSTDEFKNQMVQLYINGKRKADIIKEYDLSTTVLDRWIKQAQATGSFKEKDNSSPEEKELIRLRKRINR